MKQGKGEPGAAAGAACGGHPVFRLVPHKSPAPLPRKRASGAVFRVVGPGGLALPPAVASIKRCPFWSLVRAQLPALLIRLARLRASPLRGTSRSLLSKKPPSLGFFAFVPHLCSLVAPAGSLGSVLRDLLRATPIQRAT